MVHHGNLHGGCQLVPINGSIMDLHLAGLPSGHGFIITFSAEITVGQLLENHLVRHGWQT